METKAKKGGQRQKHCLSPWQTTQLLDMKTGVIYWFLRFFRQISSVWGHSLTRWIAEGRRILTFFVHLDQCLNYCEHLWSLHFWPILPPFWPLETIYTAQKQPKITTTTQKWSKIRSRVGFINRNCLHGFYKRPFFCDYIAPKFYSIENALHLLASFSPISCSQHPLLAQQQGKYFENIVFRWREAGNFSLRKKRRIGGKLSQFFAHVYLSRWISFPSSGSENIFFVCDIFMAEKGGPNSWKNIR